MNSQYHELFSAFAEARAAFVALRGREDAPDAALAQDPDYRRLYRSGMIIAYFGGGPAIVGAIDALTDDAQSQASMRRYWAGMDEWPPQTQLH